MELHREEKREERKRGGQEDKRGESKGGRYKIRFQTLQVSF